MSMGRSDRSAFEERMAKREREWQERDRLAREKREANRARRGTPQRFTLTGMKMHRHEWEEDGQTVSDHSWTLPDIDPPVEQDEEIEVVDAAAYDRLREFVDNLIAGRYFGGGWADKIMAAAKEARDG